MKKILYVFCFIFFGYGLLWSQCVPTCSNYAVLPLTTFTPFPMVGNNAVPLFSPNTDDGHTPPVPLGFNFDFYCTTYSTVLVYSNGLLQFDIGVPSTYPLGYDPAQLIPNPSLPTILNGIVAFKMDDLDPTVGGTVTYTTLGVSPNQMFVLSYSNVPIFGNASLLNSGQIVLYETSNIIDIYSISAPLSPNLATQGIENQTGTLATAAPGRNQTNWSATNSAYRFLPFTPAPPSSINGSTFLCQGDQSVYLTTPIPSVIQYNWSFPAGWNGTSTTSAVTATVGTSGYISVSATYTCGISTPYTLAVTSVSAPVVAITSASPSVLCSGNQFTVNTTGAVSYTLEPGSIIGTPPFIVVASSSAVYSLSGTNSAGCNSFNTATTNIVVNPTPTVTINSGSVCIGQSFTLSPSGANTYQFYNGFAQVTPTLGINSYSVSGTSTAGCTGAPAVSQVTALPLPNLQVVSSKTTICTKQSATLTASGATSYLWSNGSTSVSTIVSPTLHTVYTVTGTASGCISSTTITQFVNPCVGIKEWVVEENGSLVFPNPTNADFTILNPFSGETVKFELFNSLSQVVASGEIIGESLKFNVDDIRSGLYYVIVKSQAKSYLSKLIITD